MVERRTSTGESRLLGGLARGRPILATVVLTTGVIALAVPLSASFAGEFLILAGAFQQHWAWAVVGAVAIPLAAMYMLRAISALLHQDVGPAVPESALDLRPGELAVVVPLLLCLIGLSVWPNLVSGHAFAPPSASVQLGSGLEAVRAQSPANQLASLLTVTPAETCITTTSANTGQSACVSAGLGVISGGGQWTASIGSITATGYGP
jgi:formate hydrogenlyase subunit 3/multisubunit Na+/H+ antiporter MnhD subunit